MNKSRTLYISDLDGTLLNSDSIVPQTSIEIINPLLKKGLLFTVATARTPATVVPLLQQLDLNIPAVLMNGAVLYDVRNTRYIHTNPFTDADLVLHYIALLKGRGLIPFVYHIDNNKLKVFHAPLNNEGQRQFKCERENTPYKDFIPVDDYLTPTDNPPLFLLVIDQIERLQTAAAEIERIGNCTLYCYQDVLRPQYGNLEIYPKGVSKATTAQHIIDRLNPWEVVAFGDNLNDLPLFTHADRCYATGNALDEAKRQATATIGSNNHDGVAQFLLQDFLK